MMCGSSEYTEGLGVQCVAMSTAILAHACQVLPVSGGWVTHRRGDEQVCHSATPLTT